MDWRLQAERQFEESLASLLALLLGHATQIRAELFHFGLIWNVYQNDPHSTRVIITLFRKHNAKIILTYFTLVYWVSCPQPSELKAIA